MKKRLLISANDFGSGTALYPVYEACLSHHNEIEVSCLISGPSQELFPQDREGRIYHLPLPSEGLDSPDYLQKFQEELTKYTNILRPDVLLTGISGSYAGIDEVLLKVCKEKIPTFSFQDYWGYVNLNLGVHADHIFLLDSLALEVTATKIMAPTSIVGSPKYDYYVAKKREEISQHLDTSSSPDYDLFIGQPLWHLPSYKQTLEIVIEAYEKTTRKLIYLLHPLEESFLIDSASKHGNITILEARPSCIESLMMRAVKILSCFSTCLFDAFLLKDLMKAKAPQLASVMMFDELLEAHKKYSGGLEFFPLANKGASNIETPLELERFIEDNIILQNDHILEQYGGASQKILDQIMASLRKH